MKLFPRIQSLLSWPRPFARKVRLPIDLDANMQSIVQRTRPFTMTSVERVIALVDSIRYIARNNVLGSIVECGVWRGGSSMAAAIALLECNDYRRFLYLYDTFAGMTKPSATDYDCNGVSAAEHLMGTPAGKGVWCEASEEDVRRNMESTGYSAALIRYIRGRVEDTIPATMPERIALLRIDTDWYESTKHELEHLFPRLSQGGVLIIDDYGHWQGARKAVDEYFLNYPGYFLHRVDYTCRLLIKK